MTGDAPVTDKARARPWCANGKCIFVGWEASHEGERFIAKIEFDAPPDVPLSIAWGADVSITPADSFDESRALLKEAQNLYESLDAVIPTREFDRFEKYTIEFSGDAINNLRASLARIRAHLGE